MKTEGTFQQHEKEFHQFLAEWGVSDPRGLDLMRLLNASARMLEVLADHHLQTHDLSVPRLRLLVLLHAEDYRGNKQGVSPSRLSEYQHISKNTVSALLDSLEKQGLIERTLNRDDKRMFNIRLSRTGRDLVRKILPSHSAHLTEAFAEFSVEEQTALLKLLRKLRGSLVNQIASKANH